MNPNEAHERWPTKGTRTILVVWAILILSPTITLAQIPGLPKASPAPAPKPDPSQRPVPAKGEAGAIFSATSGPIHVNQKVSDDDIKKTLTELLTQFPGVINVNVTAKDGAVTLDGHLDDDDTMDDVTAFAQKVDGVRLVLNKMKTDAEILTGGQMALKVLKEYRHLFAKNWLLTIVAIVLAIFFGFLAKMFNRYSETILSPLLSNSLLRSVIGSVISTLIVVAGFLLGLSVLNLTHVVLSVLGLAGVAGLALGFAFKDIAENFIASMLLGVRRPFQIGDFITVAGKSGSVLSLNTRETMLITPEGNHVRIPNAVIYKETLINASTSPNSLGSIDVMIPYEASTADALDAINDALQATEGLLQEPTPRALVQSLEINGIKLHASYWMPSKGLDGDKLQSDLRLRIKVALQKAGITPPSNLSTISISGRVPVEMFEARPSTNGHVAAPAEQAVPTGAVVTPTQAEANLRKDTEAAESTADEPSAPQISPIDHAIKQAVVQAEAEGNNMLVGSR